MVSSNNGNEEDAEDLFQDSLLVIYKKIKANELELTCSFRTYLYSVSRNLWLQKLSKKMQMEDVFADSEGYFVFDEHEISERNEAEIEKLRLYQQHFLTLSNDCQKVLILFMKKMSSKAIAQEMGFKNEKYAKTRKYLCKEELKKRIINDPKCQKFLSND
jgi:RNA polymerase sigma factor (sigma-70 family)